MNIQNGSLRRFGSLIEEGANENREMRGVLSFVNQQRASAFMLFKRIRREIGSVYKSTRETVN